MEHATVVCRTTSVDETLALGQQLGRFMKSYRKPLCIALVGDLGTGKTHLSKGIGMGFGVTDDITSPTFAIMNTYEVGRKTLYHFDVYRLDDIEELENIGFSEFTDKTKSIVEWANKFPEALPRHTCMVSLETVGDGERKITLSATVLSQAELEDIGGRYVLRD